MITPELKIKIRNLHKEGLRVGEIASKLKLIPQTVSYYIRNPSTELAIVEKTCKDCGNNYKSFNQFGSPLCYSCRTKHQKKKQNGN